MDQRCASFVCLLWALAAAGCGVPGPGSGGSSLDTGADGLSIDEPHSDLDVRLGLADGPPGAGGPDPDPAAPEGDLSGDAAGGDTGLSFDDIDEWETLDVRRTYRASDAVSYADRNWNRTYGTGASQNPWGNYGGASGGGNCTNFVSQAIIGGLIRDRDAWDTFNARTDFDIDRDTTSSLRWFWRSATDRGSAFTGAQALYNYAVGNRATYKGLHFTYVTHDTHSAFMAYTAVREGDVIFADWTGNGSIDHAMLVTDTNGLRLGYNEIQVTYQSTNTHDRGLGDINEQYGYRALFYVYRPVDYNPAGL